MHESTNQSQTHLYLASPPISRSTASLHLSRGILSTMGLMSCRDANWNISRIRARPPTQLPTTLNSAILINRASSLCDSENDRPILSVKRPTEHLKNTQDTQHPPTQLLHATQEASHARSSVKVGSSEVWKKRLEFRKTRLATRDTLLCGITKKQLSYNQMYAQMQQPVVSNASRPQQTPAKPQAAPHCQCLCRTKPKLNVRPYILHAASVCCMWVVCHVICVACAHSC